MHEPVRQWVRDNLPSVYESVLECGSQDMNGGIRDLLHPCNYLGIDIAEGPGVDIVTDFATYRSDGFDVVICCEVYEHTPDWPALVEAAAANLNPGGTFIATMAGPGRPPHSGRAATGLEPGEYYRNVHPAELETELARWFESWRVDVAGFDLRCAATG